MRGGNVCALILFWVSALALIVPCAPAANYSESIDGDLSNDHTNPTPFALSVGANVLTATTGLAGDPDYVRADVPVGTRFARLVLQSYTNNEVPAFIGMRVGTIIPTATCCTAPSDLSGYTVFGPGFASVGEDILPEMGAAVLAMGFTPPLASGSYTFWSHQATGVSTSYEFNFNVELPPNISGDYNNDNVVDAADYVSWRDTLGQTGVGLRADGDHNGVIDMLDYSLWRAQFGATAGGGSGTRSGISTRSVPEPISALLLILGATTVLLRRRRIGVERFLP
jgi:hypothetical protein